MHEISSQSRFVHATVEPVQESACDTNGGREGGERAVAPAELPGAAGKPWAVWLKEEMAVLFYIWTFFLQLWCWLLAIWLLVYVPLIRVPLLGYITYITIGPGNRASSNPAAWPTPLRHAPWHRYIASYFPMSLVRDAPLDPNQRYIFGYHPHGIFAIGAWVTFCTEALGFSTKFPGLHVHALTLTSNLRAPFLREYLLMHGVGDVSKRSIRAILNRGVGAAVMIVVGGASESLFSSPGRYDLCLKRRKGFVKLALQTGAWLVPTLSFGENDHFWSVSELPEQGVVRRWQRAVEHATGFTLPIVVGRGFLVGRRGPLPYRARTTVVTGPPVQVSKFTGDQGSAEFRAAVDAVHDKYCKALMELWDKYKDTYAPHRKSDLYLRE